jgi:hypothetical protein
MALLKVSPSYATRADREVDSCATDKKPMCSTHRTDERRRQEKITFVCIYRGNEKRAPCNGKWGNVLGLRPGTPSQWACTGSEHLPNRQFQRRIQSGEDPLIAVTSMGYKMIMHILAAVDVFHAIGMWRDPYGRLWAMSTSVDRHSSGGCVKGFVIAINVN